MEPIRNFWVVGGDQRQVWLARLLAEDGHTVHTYALDLPPDAGDGPVARSSLERIDRADCVVLPLPVAGEGLTLHAPLAPAAPPLAQVLDRLTPGQVLCGGRVDPAVQALAGARGLTIHDYFAREELAVANAVPTAEGALQLAMEHLPITIHRSRVLILGFGRVGRATGQRFAALGARVTVAARRYDQLAWAQAMGLEWEPLDQPAGWQCNYDLVVNTIPARVLGREELAALRPDCLILDLASKPGGVDLAAAGELGLTVIWALSLPGKVAPVSAGRAIQQAIYHLLHELGQ